MSLVVGGVSLHVWRGRSVLKKWVAENGYELVKRERRFLCKGPFVGRTSKGQEVHYVTIRDTSGRERSGYVCCGSYWLGILSDQVSVCWDDQDGETNATTVETGNRRGADQRRF